MDIPAGKHAWMVKIGEKGQFVIPKEARDLFGLHPGDSILVLGNEEKGLAIPSKRVRDKVLSELFDQLNEPETEE